MAVRSMSYPSSPAFETSRGGRWRALALVGIGVGIGTAGTLVPPGQKTATPPAWSAAAAPGTPRVAFLARANGVITRPAELSSLPGGGRALVTMDPGAPLEVGGEVNVRAGLARRTMYWVRLTTPPQSYGFVPADVVALSNDAPIAPIDMSGLGEADWLAPATGVQQARGGAGIVAEDGMSDPASARLPAALSIAWLPDTVRRFGALLADAGLRHGVDPAFLAIIALVESGGNPAAISGSGARGLMQIMPSTAATIDHSCSDAPFDAATSIDCGARYLAEQLRAFGLADDPDWATSVERAAAAYNGGPNAVKGWLAGGSLPAEAQRYRRWVAGMWRERAGDDSAAYRAWLAAGGTKLVEAAADAEG